MLSRNLTAALLIAILAACGPACARDPREDVVDRGRPVESVKMKWPAHLPFFPEQVTAVWHFDGGKILVEYRCGKAVLHCVVTEDGYVQLTGTGSLARIQSITADSVTFMCYGEMDTPFMAFPYQLVHHVDTGLTVRREVFLDPGSGVEFGGWLRDGLLLTAVLVERDGVTFSFRTATEKMPDLGGPSMNIPRTAVSWVEMRTALVLSFRGTRPEPGFTGPEFSDSGPTIVSDVQIVHDPDRTLATVRLSSARAYTARYTWGSEPTLTIVWADEKAESEGP